MVHVGVVMVNWQGLGQFGSASSTLFLGVSKCIHDFHKQSLSFLQPLCMSNWFSSQLRELIFLVLDPRENKMEKEKIFRDIVEENSF